LWSVVVTFVFCALMFNGLVCAMLTSDAASSNLSKLQRMLTSNPFLRWMLRPYARAPFKTSGDLKQRRTCLSALGIKLAVISVNHLVPTVLRFAHHTSHITLHTSLLTPHTAYVRFYVDIEMSGSHTAFNHQSNSCTSAQAS
jgi:hypothetical protein